MQFKRLFDPSAYYWKISKYYYSLLYDEKKIKEEEESLYKNFDLDFNDGKKHFEERLPELASLNVSMGSNHWILFASIAMVDDSINRILEIGTYDGLTTKVLSVLFPKAEIVTYELPEHDTNFVSSYGRDEAEERQRFLNQRSKNLGTSSNIKFEPSNSFFILNKTKSPFDLIWIDGCHLSPEVNWDLHSAFYASHDSSWILIDDVVMHSFSYPDPYVDGESYKAIKHLANITGENASFFIKRFSSEFSAHPRIRKHIGVIKRGWKGIKHPNK